MLINDSSTTSKRSIWPEEMRGLWVVGAGGSELELSNGKNYDDWSSALGAVTLGYDRFNNPYDPPQTFTPATSLPWQVEHDFAEEFCQAMGTEAVRFFKSGSDAVSCAVRLARAYTKREFIIIFKECYHGTSEVFSPIFWTREGTTWADQPVSTRQFGYRLDVQGAMEIGFADVAAIVVEPAPKAIVEPPAGWLQHLREVCDEHGILLITDEVILGYRHALQGYLQHAGVRADVSCYGKAMGQGAAISAVAGRHDVLELLAGSVHFSGTNNGEPLPLHIARETLSEYIREDVCAKLNAKGLRLKLLLNSNGFQTRGLNSRFEITDWDMKATKFMFDRGILFPGWASLAVSHSDEQMQRLVDALKEWRES